MIEWYNSLSALEYVFFYIGCISGIFLIVQLIIMCISSFGADIDADGDVDVDTDAGVSLFTVKSLTAFFAVGGWSGLLMCSIDGVPDWAAIIVSIVAGAAAMAAVVLFMRAAMKLQCSGNVHTDKLVGMSATVYVSVPPCREGRGKITLEAQGRFMELDAMTDEKERIKTDERVTICDVENDCMMVKKVQNSELSDERADE